MAPIFGKKTELTPEIIGEYFDKRAAEFKTLLTKAAETEKKLSGTTARLEKNFKKVDELDKKVKEFETTSVSLGKALREVKGLPAAAAAASEKVAAAATRLAQVEKQLQALTEKQAELLALEKEIRTLR
jgi:predicted  nucleic acid-binding Zn-ribbon protein